MPRRHERIGPNAAGSFFGVVLTGLLSSCLTVDIIVAIKVWNLVSDRVVILRGGCVQMY